MLQRGTFENLIRFRNFVNIKSYKLALSSVSTNTFRIMLQCIRHICVFMHTQSKLSVVEAILFIFLCLCNQVTNNTLVLFTCNSDLENDILLP